MARRVAAVVPRLPLRHGPLRRGHDVPEAAGDLEHLFVLIVFGDIVGIPILPPYYTLRLLPYIIPEVNNWKRRMLREKDLTDLAGAG